jgi:hypothetical protein
MNFRLIEFISKSVSLLKTDKFIKVLYKIN